MKSFVNTFVGIALFEAAARVTTIGSNRLKGFIIQNIRDDKWGKNAILEGIKGLQ